MSRSTMRAAAAAMDGMLISGPRTAQAHRLIRNRLPIACATLALAPAAAHAQASQVPTLQRETQPAELSMELEEIIVTAQKREERLIDAPQSVSVLTSESLSKLGATQFRDFADTVPGLSFSTAGAGNTQINLRGVTAGIPVSPTVGVYVDDVPYGSSTAFARGNLLALDVGLFDLDRIEVLRGPQGTLYGASTMGGLLKYVGNQPDMSSFGVDGEVGISDTRQGEVSYNGNATINVPIVADKAALRASGFYVRDAGYIDNLTLGQEDVNRARIYGGRADFSIAPTDALTIRLAGVLQNIAREGTAAADFTLAGRPVDDRLDQRRRIEEPFDQQFRLASGTVSYDFGPAALTSISSYQESEVRFILDFSNTFVPVLAGLGLPFSSIGVDNLPTTKKFTQEIRLASIGTNELEWLVGGFYTHESSQFVQAFLLRDLAGQPVPNNLLALSTPSEYEEIAGFANLTYFFSDKFDVSGGVRYAHNQQVSTQIGSGPLVASTPTRRTRDDVLTYLANARYHLSDRATAYLRYATGYRPGGANSVLNDPATGIPLAPATFEDDRLTSYEAGFKAESADRTFSIDLAGYSIDWSNIQVLAVRNGFASVVNAPDGATIRGAELTLGARPDRNFTASGAFAYQDAHLSAANADLGANKDEPLPGVPRYSATLNADYELSVSDLRPSFGATLRYVYDRTASFDNSTAQPQYELPDYTTVDLRAGVTTGPVRLQLYVRNLFDVRAQNLSLTFTSGIPGVTTPIAIQQPRTIGLSATTRF